MEYLQHILENPHASETIIYLMAALLAFQAIVKLIDWFREKWGFFTKDEIHEKEQTQTIDCVKKDIAQIKKDQAEYQQEVRDFQERTVKTQEQMIQSLHEMQEEITDENISQLRHNILDFANAIRHREYDKEQYNYILDCITGYDELIKKTGRVNGKVDAAARYIRTRYDEYMVKGFPYE